MGRIVYFAVSYMVIQAGRGPGFASIPWLAVPCAHCLCRAALARERVALTFPGMKRPAQNRNHGTSNAALLSVLRKIPKGQTRSKMEVFRQVLQELGRGDEGIDTGATAASPNRRGTAKASSFPLYTLATSRIVCRGVEKWQPEAVEPLHSKATLKERLVLSGGKFFFHPDIPKPLPPAFPRKRSSQKKPCKTFKAAMKMVRPRLHQALGAAEFAELQRTGAVRLRSILHSEECAELLDFASRANFPDVRRLDGEAGRGGAYHFCKGSPPPLVEAIRTSLYESILDHLPSLSQRFGKSLADLEKRCRAAGQRRSATIFLAFGEGGVNLAHQVLRTRCGNIGESWDVVSREFVEAEGEVHQAGSARVVELSLFWSGHSPRHFLPSLAAALGIDEKRRDFLGRWAAARQGSTAYVLTARQIIQQIQGEVCKGLLVGEPAPGYIEEKLLFHMKAFSERHGIALSAVKRHHVLEWCPLTLRWSLQGKYPAFDVDPDANQQAERCLETIPLYEINADSADAICKLCANSLERRAAIAAVISAWEACQQFAAKEQELRAEARVREFWEWRGLSVRRIVAQ
ncbi:unnamed protein product [Symbiodinium sp. KB8]|nr:unnamed protein product [Symbiodinium sp. KB8]